MTLGAFTVPGIGFEIPPEIVVLGLVTGLTYALLGVGLVLVYKSSGVLNFAHGEMGALAAGLLPTLIIRYHLNYWLSFLLALALSAAAGALMQLVVIRRLASAPRLIVLVATIGTAQLFFAIAVVFLPKAENLGTSAFPVPFETSVTFGSLRLGTAQLLILLVVPLISVALALFFRATRLGLASRAAADNHDAAELAGVPAQGVALAIWTLAGAVAGLSAMLIGPTRPLATQAALGPELMLRALSAAVIGGMVSIPQVFLGGLLIGLVELLISWNYPTGGILQVVLVLLVLASLVARRQLGQVARGSEAGGWSLAGGLRLLDPRVARLPTVRRLRRAMLIGVVAVAVVAPLPLDNSQRSLLSSIALFAVIGLTLVILTGFAGQVSLGQFALVGLGAMVGGRMASLGYPAFMGILYAAAAGGLVALFIGLPALRLRGVFLAVTTLGFAVASQSWLPQQRWLVQTDGGRTSLELPRQVWMGIQLQSERNYYWLCLALLIIVASVVHRVRGTGVGRSMMAVRDNEAGAAALGISPRRTKLTAFVLSGILAAIAGYFYGGLLVRFNGPASFAPELSLTIVAMVILGGVTTVTGAVAGALWVLGVGRLIAPLLPGAAAGAVTLLVSGPGLLAVLLLFPGGLASVVFRLRDWFLTRVIGVPTDVAADAFAAAATPLHAPRSALPPREPPAHQTDAPSPAIEAEGVVVGFGGVIAVSDVSLRAEQGEIVGLVGPNGAGKTTLFDVLSGQLRPSQGRVLLAGVDVTSLRPEQRARLGLGRTFQQARLFKEMALIDVFKVALECQAPSEVVPSLLGLPPSRHAEARKELRADELVELLGLGAYAYHNVSELSTGIRRLVELGTVVGLGARVLLLDEPTAGIAQRDVEALRPVLRQIGEHLGATMVVIEHDIPLMVDLVDRLYVLAAGHVIAEGPPSVLYSDRRVVEAYLGTDDRVIQRSGGSATPPGSMTR